MRILVVDDSTVFRKVVRDALAGEPGVEVVGTAANGAIALEKIRDLKPDVVTLDLEMPEVDGLEVLRRLKSDPAAPRVIMVSSFTAEGATLTTQALRLGAFDFIRKPDAASLEANCKALRDEIGPKLKLLAASRADQAYVADAAPSAGQPALCRVPMVDMGRVQQAPRPSVVAIGVSTGGPSALAAMLPKLPADLPTPVLIVQHMPPMFTRSLADDLNRSCKLQVTEAAAGDVLSAGRVYIAPGGRQMKAIAGTCGDAIAISEDPPEKNCRPSVDYLFRSLAHLYGARVLAVVMTGMGDDGALGCRLLKRAGATVIAQHEASCVVYGMPRQVVEAGLADMIVPLDQLADVITQCVGGGVLACR